MIFSIAKITQRKNEKKKDLKSPDSSQNMILLTDLKIDTEYKAVFEQKEDKVNRIAEDMKIYGYDKSQPIIVLPDFTIIDGHSRYLAAQKANIVSVPIVVKDFATKEESLLYMYHLQLDRRNLTDQELFSAYLKLDELKNSAKNEGKSAKDYTDDKLAEQLHISPRQLSKIREVQKKSSPEIQKQIVEGNCSINQAHGLLKQNKTPKTPAVNDDEFIHGFRFAILELSKGRKPHEIYRSLQKLESGKPVFSQLEEKRLQEILCRDSIS